MHSVLTRLVPGDPRSGARQTVAEWLRQEQGGAFVRDDCGEMVTQDAWVRGSGDPVEFKRKLMPLVNRFTKAELGTDDVLIGGSYVCNSDRDYYYSRFSRSALGEAAEMIVGRPKMRMHNTKTGSSEARTFDADVVTREIPGKAKRDSYWLKTNWYTLNNDAGQQLMERVRGGLDDEVSIGWSCAGADCSECGDPIFACRHIPGDIYSKGLAEFEFSGMIRVVEDSFVFAGGQKNTTNFIPDGERGADVAAVATAVNRFLDAVSGELAWDRIASAKRDFLMNVEQMPRSIRAAAETHRRALGMATMCAEPGERRNTQAILLSKEKFPDVRDAARWARDHEFRADKRSETALGWRLAQMSSALFHPGKEEWREQHLDPGVTAAIGTRKEKEESRGRDGSRSVEALLAR